MDSTNPVSDARQMQMPERDSSATLARPSLVTLGGFTLTSHPLQSPTALLGPGKPLALLLYLHSTPGHAASREHLTDLLWADLEPAAARHALRQTLWYLRQRLGADCIRTDNGDISLDLALASDRDAFLEAVTENRLDDAVDLYVGHFLPDFAVPGGLEFEYWADAERTRLRLMFLRSAEMAARRQLSLGHVRPARDLAVRARDLNPASESAWRLFVETLVAGHEATLAMAELEQLCSMLARDGRAPEPATRALMRSIGDEPPGAEAEPPGLMAELVGREREFATIVDAWESTSAGSRHRFHVTAAAGLGKTRLLSDIEARLRASGAVVVHVGAKVGGRHLPYSLAANLAAALAGLAGAKAISQACAGALVALNPALSSTFDATEDRATGDEALRRRTIALTELVQAVIEESPIALLIDDLHWADQASRQVLNGVLGPQESTGILVVTASRPSPDLPMVPETDRIELSPLSADNVGAMMASIGTLSPDLTDLPRTVWQATGGSPLLVLESLLAAMEDGTLALRDGGWTVPDESALAARFSTGSAMRDRVARLERNDEWLLLLLATGGMPLSADILSAVVGHAVEEGTVGLSSLEQRGFVQRAPDGWQPAHDEIAAIAWDLASEEARRAASSQLGEALTGNAKSARNLAPRGAQLLAQAGAEEALERFFRHWLRDRRRAGDRRPARTLAADALGLSDPALINRLARSLPLTDRMGLTPAALSIGVAAVLIVSAFTLGTLTRDRPAPDAVLLVAGTDVRGSPIAHEVRLFASNWAASVPLDATEGRSRPRLADAGTWYGRAGTLDGLTWARSVPSDTGSVDVVIRKRDGSETWLTSGPADDNFEDWSPDGRFVAISTGRWHARSMYDVATIEVPTGAIRQLTQGDGHDILARWSPEGSRLALIRRFLLSGGPDQICWVTADGVTEQCRTIEHRTLVSLEWMSPTELVVVFSRDGEQGALQLDLATGAARALDIRGADIRLSPDGSWAVCRCLPSGAQRLGWYVLPLDRPERLRLVTWGSSPDATMSFHWAAAARGAGFLERLEIDSLPGAVPVGSVIRPTAIGRDRDGRIVRTPVLIWSVSDSALASVRSDGAILTRAVGAVVLTASAGGWRTDTTTIRVHADTARTVIHESWRDDLATSWRAYGVPRPLVLADSVGPALLVNGDGSHYSGVYSRQTVRADKGLGLEVMLKTPVSAPQWQHLGVRVVAPVDEVSLAAWDHISGAPLSLDVPPRTCSAGAGSTGIEDGVLHLSLAAGGIHKRVSLPWPPAEERWYRIRIQVLSDGRCGFALNGEPVWVARAHLPMDRPFRIVLDGQTVGSKLLVGPLEAWEGVRMDVDWSAMER